MVGKYQILHECKACKRKRIYTGRKKQRETIDGALKIIHKHLYQGARKRNIPYEITQQDLKNIREHQQGKCYYTGYEMSFTYVGNKL